MNRTFRAAMLGTTILSATSLVAYSQDAQPETGMLPPVEIAQPQSATPKSKPKKKAAKKTPTPSSAQPVIAPPSSFEGQAETPEITDARVASGTRSGSLTAPTMAEARAEIQTTPGGVALVDAKDYKQATPATTLKDALDYVPGVFVQPKWGDDTRLSIRGSGLSRNFHGRGIYLLMDGVIPITTSDGASDFQEIDPTAYRYVEVYKGANALRWGANSLGGAINFVMPTGYDSDLFGARLDIGAFGFRKLTASSGAVSGPADYFITGTWQEQDGFRDHSDGESVRGAMNIGYRLSRDAETRFYLNANHVRQRIPGAVTREQALANPKAAFEIPGEPVGFLGMGDDNVDRDYRRNLDSIRVGNKTTVRIAPGTFIDFGAFYFNRHLDHPILLVVDNRNNEVGGFGRITDERAIGDHKNRLVAGISVHYGDIRARTYRNILGERGALLSDADQTSTTTTAYLENTFYLTPTFGLVAGTQYTNIDRTLDDRFLSNGDESRSADFDFWSPKIGFLWDVTRDAQIFGNMSRSHEAATFNEITYVSGDTLALDPQEATTYEVGIRGKLHKAFWDVSLYRSNLSNEFQCLSAGGTGTCTQTNLDKTIHQGVELGFGLEIASGIFERGLATDALWLHTAYTFSDFRFDNDANFGNNELPGAPRHVLRGELLYKHPSGIYLGPNVEWVPEAYYVDSENTLKTARYALLGAKIGFDNGGPMTAYLEGRNLLDEAYIASASIATSATASSPLFEPGNGRAIYAGVQLKW